MAEKAVESTTSGLLQQNEKEISACPGTWIRIAYGFKRLRREEI